MSSEFSSKPFSTVGFYYPIKGEVDTRPFFDFFKKRKLAAAFPKVLSVENKEMDFFTVSDWSELNTGMYGIAEPKPGVAVFPDLLLVPGAAFSKDGHRLGYGAGFYDKYLSRWRQEKPEGLSVGLAYDFQVLDSVPFDSHDQKLDALFSESEF